MHVIVKSHPDSNADSVDSGNASSHTGRGSRAVLARRWDIMSPARMPRAVLARRWDIGAGTSALGHHESPTGILKVPALGLNVRFEST